MKLHRRKCPQGTGFQGWVGCCTESLYGEGAQVGVSADPDPALTSSLPAEGAEFGFYFPELAFPGDTLTVETRWKGGFGLGHLGAEEGERLGCWD